MLFGCFFKGFAASEICLYVFCVHVIMNRQTQMKATYKIHVTSSFVFLPGLADMVLRDYATYSGVLNRANLHETKLSIYNILGLSKLTC